MSSGAKKPWQHEGDWPCPNPSCNNINFAFRGECNRCSTPRPPGAGPPPGASSGKERGKGDPSKSSAPLFGPNDWPCPMCGNVNWAKRLKCNICNTSRPGAADGGPREGKAGGYKEFDEAEIAETKRRRKEAEEDDGEMYDEFGNLKKKYRKKTGEGGAPVAGKTVWTAVGEASSKKERREERNEDEKVSTRGDKYSGREEERRSSRRYDRDRREDDYDRDRPLSRERGSKDRFDDDRRSYKSDRRRDRERDRFD